MRPGLATNFVNGAFIQQKNLTAEANYSFNMAALGVPDLNVDLAGSFFYVKSFSQSNNGVTIVNNKGVLGQVPTYSGQANIGLSYDKVFFDVQANYQSKQVFDRTFTAETRDILGVGDYWLWNSTIGVKTGDQSTVRLTVSNVFDRDPPFPLTTNGLGVYDYLGRRFTVAFQQKF